MHVQLRGAMMNQPSDSFGENLFLIPLEDGNHSLVYAPLDKVAFVANAGLTDRIASFIREKGTSDVELGAWLHEIGITDDSAPEVDDVFAGPPCPTSVT